MQNPDRGHGPNVPNAGPEADYSDEQREEFGGRAWIGVEDRSLLDVAGTELLLVGAKENPIQTGRGQGWAVILGYLHMQAMCLRSQAQALCRRCARHACAADWADVELAQQVCDVTLLECLSISSNGHLATLWCCLLLNRRVEGWGCATWTSPCSPTARPNDCCCCMLRFVFCCCVQVSLVMLASCWKRQHEALTGLTGSQHGADVPPAGSMLWAESPGQAGAC